MYTYILIHTYTHTHTACTWICKFALYTQTHNHINMHTTHNQQCICTLTYTPIPTCTCTHMCIYMHMYTCAHIHLYIWVRLHTHVHRQTTKLTILQLAFHVSSQSSHLRIALHINDHLTDNDQGFFVARLMQVFMEDLILQCCIRSPCDHCQNTSWNDIHMFKVIHHCIWVNNFNELLTKVVKKFVSCTITENYK